MTDFPRSFGVDYIGGYVNTTKDYPDVIRDAVISLLIHKFPDEISDEDIAKFVQDCQRATHVAKSTLTGK